MSLYLKSALFVLVVGGFAMLCVPTLLLATTGEALPSRLGPLQASGLLLGVLGFSAYIRCILGFVRTGRGTPSPADPPRRLVAQGLYRHTRNPMYVSVLSILLSEALVFSSVTLGVYAGLVFLAFHAFVVYYEEPTLARSFGAEYEAYRRSTPRWFGLRSMRRGS